MDTLHLLGCILARPAAHVALAVLRGVEQVDANDVQLVVQVSHASIQAAPRPGLVGAPGAEMLFHPAEPERDGPATGSANDEGAADGARPGYASLWIVCVLIRPSCRWRSEMAGGRHRLAAAARRMRIPIVRDRSVQFDVITSSDSY
ncbi:MAG: hypothetical protein JSS47_16280 [Proteobacteria bacterium]|nr:hypothetical protein [Pseudomonadota bacterium]